MVVEEEMLVVLKMEVTVVTADNPCSAVFWEALVVALMLEKVVPVHVAGGGRDDGSADEGGGGC